MGNLRVLTVSSLLLSLLAIPRTADATVSVSPSPSYTGSYTVQWTDPSGGATRAYLAASLNGGSWTKSTVTGTSSKAFSNMAVGSYAYKVQIYLYDAELKKELFEYETPATAVQVWKSVPGVPGLITGPSNSASGSYALSWSEAPGLPTRYELTENGALVYSGGSTGASITGKAPATYTYAARACNPVGCGPYGTTFSVHVDVSLTDGAPDHPLSEVIPPGQGWVGTLPGRPGADGGAASYRIDIEVPPGRAGMQPSVGLTYSSKGGNGVAGVGWTVSAGASIYRCPRTLEQEGANRAVKLDDQDMLCYAGQRLVKVGSGAYGVHGTEYRTEVGPFDRITLVDPGSATPRGFLQASSTFKVEHKSGRVSVFQALPSAYSQTPASWQLAVEFDPQGNCINYQYQPFPTVHGDEWQLNAITYTGTMENGICALPTDARSVRFTYTADRNDRRIAWSNGVPSATWSRLANISTMVGAVVVRRYRLDYTYSPMTQRSLLAAVTLCGGGPCNATPGSASDPKLPPTSFGYQGGPLTNFYIDRRRVPGHPEEVMERGATVSVIGDVDGDGTLDQLYRGPGNGGQVLVLSSGQVLDTGSFGIDARGDQGSIKPFWSLDVNSDGRADLLGRDSGNLALWTWANNSFSQIATDLPASIGDGPYLAVGAMDFDGDGLVDIRLSRIEQREVGGEIVDVKLPEKVYRQISSHPLVFEGQPGAPAATIFPPQAPNNLMQPSGPPDLNGDGVPDHIFDGTFPDNSQEPTVMFLVLGPMGATYFQATLASLGGPSGTFNSTASPRRWVDMNGDGLPDIFEPGSVWINTGAPVVMQVIDGVPKATNPNYFRRVDVSMPSGLSSRVFPYSHVRDVDTDGQQEVLFPARRVEGKEYCAVDWTMSISGQTAVYEPEVYCGNDFDAMPGAPFSRDRSVFEWDAFKLVPVWNGTYKMVKQTTDFKAPKSAEIGSIDENGDGIDEAIFGLVDQFGTSPYHQYVRMGWYQNLPDAEMGPYRSAGPAVAPDLLTSARDGLGAEARWTYQPLSRKQVGVPECGVEEGPLQSPAPFYTAHHDDPNRSPGYVFFTSSMWTVSSFEAPNGFDSTGGASASGTNRTCYRYEDAMLNVRGRGFQGFKKIVAEERLPPAQGEEGSVPGTCGAGGCSVNNLITATQFNQEFPFTNTVRSVTVARARDGGQLSHALTWWHGEQQVVAGPWVVYPTAQSETKFDPSLAARPGAQAGDEVLVTSATVTEVDLDSGDPKRTCTKVDDLATARLEARRAQEGNPLPAGVASATSRLSWEERQVEANPGSPWWPGRVTSRARADVRYTPALALSQGRPATTLRTPISTTAPVACPTMAEVGAENVVSTNLVWFLDSLASGYRKVRTESVSLPVVGEEVATTWTYDAYGNPATRETTARGLKHLGVPIKHTTVYTPSADGYFVESELNAEGHVSTTQRDPATGLPVVEQAVQGGPVTTRTYDALGRPTSVATSGSRPVYQWLGDGSGCISELTTPTRDAAMRRDTLQAGAPWQVECLDALGRVVKTSTEAMSGELVGTRKEFNQRGLMTAEHAPRIEGDEDFATRYSNFDELGRVRRKGVERDATLFQADSGKSVTETEYMHLGLSTSITVNEAAGACQSLTMSRTYDGQGKLVETTQHVCSGGGRDILTRYVYDAAGRLTNIVDAKGNNLAASYDLLGRKTEVKDPDRGLWMFSWDGLGRLATQRDARGKLTTFTYDRIGRTTARTSAGASGETGQEAHWVFDLDAKGTLTKEYDADGFERETAYDGLHRPTRVTTRIPANDPVEHSRRDFVMEYGYDRVYGRVKAIRYPSFKPVGETVWLEYDDRGYLLGEAELKADWTIGRRYRKVVEMSERGQVTEQRLGNCVRELAGYDSSAGLAQWMKATLPSWQAPPPADVPLDLLNCPAANTLLVRELDYHYDRFLNLSQQDKQFGAAAAQPNGAKAEAYRYDELQRLTWASICTGSGCTPDEGGATTYMYDDLGNLTDKSDFSQPRAGGDAGYAYGTSRLTGSAGPHAVTSVRRVDGTLAEYTYDQNGNLEAGDGRRVDFDLTDRPVKVCSGTEVQCLPGAPAPEATLTEFAYGPDGARYSEKVTMPSGSVFKSKMVYAIGKNYELTVWADGMEEERSFIGPSTVVMRTLSQGTETRVVRYQHVDRLGSVEAVTADGVAAAELLADSHGFDPWGKPRARDWTGSGDLLHQGGEAGVTSTRGFTGHEHLDVHQLIHMNGRVYDYRLGRFLSVDPIISNPANSQSINPYSYIGNNPLSGTDPTGYCAEGFAKETGSNICKLTTEGAASKIAAGVNNGTITKDTTLAQVGKQIGTSNLTTVKDAVSGMAPGLKSAFGIGNGAGVATPTATNTSDPSRVNAPGTVAVQPATPIAPLTHAQQFGVPARHNGAGDELFPGTPPLSPGPNQDVVMLATIPVQRWYLSMFDHSGIIVETNDGSFVVQSGPNGGLNEASKMRGPSGQGLQLFAGEASYSVQAKWFVPAGQITESRLDTLRDQFNAARFRYDPVSGNSTCNSFTRWLGGRLGLQPPTAVPVWMHGWNTELP